MEQNLTDATKHGSAIRNANEHARKNRPGADLKKVTFCDMFIMLGPKEVST